MYKNCVYQLKSKSFQSINIKHKEREQHHQYGRICIKVAAQVASAYTKPLQPLHHITNEPGNKF